MAAILQEGQKLVVSQLVLLGCNTRFIFVDVVPGNGSSCVPCYRVADTLSDEAWFLMNKQRSRLAISMINPYKIDSTRSFERVPFANSIKHDRSTVLGKSIVVPVDLIPRVAIDEKCRKNSS
ncbi:MAG: hypothetical protein KDA87_21925 [Planctomycetales bacterium]|nr:hypothetical protein [Planctomycetales bacterium]